MDCLRAFAVLFVFISHLQQYVLQFPLNLYTLARFGVLIFFVHTSLVLLLSLQRTPYGGTAGVLNFYVRRVFRIFPLSIFTVTVLAILRIPRAPDLRYAWIGIHQLLSNLLLTQNLTGAVSTPVTLWSLPFEVQMYAVLPLFFVLFRDRNVWTGMLLWVGFTIAQFPVGGGLIGFVPCFLGGLVAYQNLGRRRAIPAQLWPVTIVMLALLHWALLKYRAPMPGLPHPLICLFLGILIPLFKELPASLLTRISHQIAKYSYGIYLSHIPVIWFVFVKLRSAPEFVRWTVFAAMSVIIPWLLYHLVEDPMIRLGRSLADWVSDKFVRLPESDLEQGLYPAA